MSVPRASGDELNISRLVGRAQLPWKDWKQRRGSAEVTGEAPSNHQGNTLTSNIKTPSWIFSSSSSSLSEQSGYPSTTNKIKKWSGRCSNRKQTTSLFLEFCSRQECKGHLFDLKPDLYWLTRVCCVHAESNFIIIAALGVRMTNWINYFLKITLLLSRMNVFRWHCNFWDSGAMDHTLLTFCGVFYILKTLHIVLTFERAESRTLKQTEGLAFIEGLLVDCSFSCQSFRMRQAFWSNLRFDLMHNHMHGFVRLLALRVHVKDEVRLLPHQI